LVKRIISEAKKRGYKFMRLDTLATMQSAIKLYKSFGFYEIPAYTFNPIPDAVYLELKLIEKI
jgi:ribosomal protein S18 acetylase RimI-like enzyme